MSWLDRILVILLSPVSVGVIIYYFSEKLKKTISHDYDKKLEKFKSALLKNQIQFSKLHQERADILKELYVKMYEMKVSLLALTAFHATENTPSQEHRYQDAVCKINDFKNFYYRKKIYFPKKLAQMINDFDSKIVEKTLTFDHNVISGCKNYISSNEIIDQWIKISADVDEQVLPMFEVIENEFRKLLGDDE